MLPQLLQLAENHLTRITRFFKPAHYLYHKSLSSYDPA